MQASEGECLRYLQIAASPLVSLVYHARSVSRFSPWISKLKIEEDFDDLAKIRELKSLAYDKCLHYKLTGLKAEAPMPIREILISR